MRRLGFFAVIASLWVFVPQSFAAFTLSASTEATVQVNNDSAAVTVIDTSDPLASASAVSDDETYKSNVQAEYTSSLMNMVFDQIRGGGAFESYAVGKSKSRFIPDVDLSYSITGQFTNSTGITFLDVYLLDLGDPLDLSNPPDVTLFSNQLGNIATTSATFAVDSIDGNAYSVLQGLLTGTLIAGHEYEWFVSAQGAGELAATGSGNFALTLTPVPEAASVIVWLAIALTIAGVAWYRQPKTAA